MAEGYVSDWESVVRRDLVKATEQGEYWYRLWSERGTEIEQLRTVLRDEYAGHEAYVDNTPCDAGNFDGGNPSDCEHCQHQRRKNVLEQLIFRRSPLCGQER